MLAVFQTLRMSDSEEFFAHEGPDVCPGDACFRALSGRRGAASSQGLALSHEVVRRQTIDDMLVDTQARKEKRKRTTDLLSVKEDIGRKFLVAKRLSEGKQGWAQEWARGQFPQRCTSDQEMRNFLRKARKYANRLGAKAGERTDVLRRSSGQGVAGICTTAVPHSSRKRRHGGGAPGCMKCPEIGDELYAWFVDTINNVKGRMPSSLLLEKARVFERDLQAWWHEQKEAGRVAPSQALSTPTLNHSWLRRWRRLHSVSWRSVNLRFKCSRGVLKSRLKVFWGNVLRVRFLHAALEPQGEFVIEGFDQKPLWFTASSQEKTLSLRGARKVAVKENVPMTRARFTGMTRCRWPTPPGDGKEIAVLFKASGGGHRIRSGLRVPPGVLLQFQEKGSYRLEDVLEYLEWILDRSRLVDPPPPPGVGPASGQASSNPEAAAASLGPGRRVMYLLDWFAPHLDPAVDDLVHSAGHAVLRVGGHLTGLVQVEDTHAHGPMTAAYKRRETEDAFEQLSVRPDCLPSTSRQTVLDRALDAWNDVNHLASSQGFVGNGIANALDGSEDADLTADVVDLWHEIGMPAHRDEIRTEVTNAIAVGQVSTFEHYVRLLKPYDDHPVMREGQEAGQTDPKDDDDSSTSGTPDDCDDDPLLPPDPPPDEPPLGSTTGFEPSGASVGAGSAGAIRLRTKTSPSCIQGLRIAHLPGFEPTPHALAPRARLALEADIEAKRSATIAALEAVVSAGGDPQLEDTLRQRLRGLTRQATAMHDESRVRLRALQMERQQAVETLRAESKAQEAAEKELALTVQLRQAEADIAKVRGREAATAAKQIADAAKAKRAEEQRLRAKEEAKKEFLRLHFAAYLVSQLNEYLREGDVGKDRSDRAFRCASNAARRKLGLTSLAIPRFWNPTTSGLINLACPAGTRLRAKQVPVYASPEFTWVLFGRKQRLDDNPKIAFANLVERLMPGYRSVLGVRYGVDNLLVECRQSLDLAFLAANWRYTKVVEKNFYRLGLNDWPPDDDCLPLQFQTASSEAVSSQAAAHAEPAFASESASSQAGPGPLVAGAVSEQHALGGASAGAAKSG